jgi:hypothetical protein
MTALVQPSIRAAISHARHVAAKPLRWDPANHLLSRFAFGPTARSRAYVAEHGPDGWYRNQVALAHKFPGYRGNAKVAAQGPLLKLSPYDLRQWLSAHGNEYGWDAMDQLTEVTLGLQAWNQAQLYETLVDFFSNHLHVPNHNGDLWVVRHAYDRDVIRRHAVGSFTDMLLAAAKHPAMLLYLNLAESTKTAVNENYGRELLELHTVGLNYTEDDVVNCARALTGRTVDDYFHYLFDDYIHATGPIKVLGFRAGDRRAAAGEALGDSLLRYLARHPATARHLATKLCVRFVSDTPSPALVSAVAQAYLHSGTQILPMVSTILRSTEFWASRGRKVRKPAENVIATLRLLGVGVSDWDKALQSLHWLTADMGNCPLDWPAPNGYPDVAAAWRSSGNLLQIWRSHIGLVGGWWGGLRAVDVGALYGVRPATSGEAIQRLGRRLTGMELSDAHRAVLLRFLGESASTPMANSTLRWLDQPLAALILDGPHHALR